MGTNTAEWSPAAPPHPPWPPCQVACLLPAFNGQVGVLRGEVDMGGASGHCLQRVFPAVHARHGELWAEVVQAARHGGLWAEVVQAARHGGLWAEVVQAARHGGLWAEVVQAARHGGLWAEVVVVAGMILSGTGRKKKKKAQEINTGTGQKIKTNTLS